MQSISIAELLLVIFVIVADWYQDQGQIILKGKPGKKPWFSDSEVITLMLAQDFIPYPGENQFVGYMKANYFDLFPKLITQSQFNRRARNLKYFGYKLVSVCTMKGIPLVYELVPVNTVVDPKSWTGGIVDNEVKNEEKQIIIFNRAFYCFVDIMVYFRQSVFYRYLNL